jgi:hypothetical protein
MLELSSPGPPDRPLRRKGRGAGPLPWHCPGAGQRSHAPASPGTTPLRPQGGGAAGWPHNRRRLPKPTSPRSLLHAARRRGAGGRKELPSARLQRQGGGQGHGGGCRGAPCGAHFRRPTARTSPGMRRGPQGRGAAGSARSWAAAGAPPAAPGGAPQAEGSLAGGSQRRACQPAVGPPPPGLLASPARQRRWKAGAGAQGAREG